MRHHNPSLIYYLLFKKRFQMVFLLLLLAIELIFCGIILQEERQTQRNAHYLCLSCLGLE